MSAQPSTAVQSWAKAIAEAERKFTEIAVPDGNLVTFQREAMFAMQRIGADATMQKCEYNSVRNSLINVAAVGLTLNPAMRLAYLVPRNDREKGMLCCLDISYIGLVKIATDSGGVRAVSATIVRKNDPFVFRGAFEKPDHAYDPFATVEQRGEIIGVYSTALLPSGVTQIDTLSMEEIAKIRTMSKAKSGPWFDWEEEMIKKSVLKRASKLWPRTERLSQAEQILNEHQGNEKTIDGSAEVIQMPQSKSRPVTIDASTGEIIEPKSAPAAPSASSSSESSSGAAVGGAAADAVPQPMKPSQANIIRAKLKNAALTEVDLEAAFQGKSLEPKAGKELFAFGEFAALVEWISKNAKG